MTRWRPASVWVCCPLLYSISCDLHHLFHSDEYFLSLSAYSLVCGYLMMNFVPFLWFAYISCNVMFLGSSTIYNLPSVVISVSLLLVMTSTRLKLLLLIKVKLFRWVFYWWVRVISSHYGCSVRLCCYSFDCDCHLWAQQATSSDVRSLFQYILESSIIL